MPRVVPSDVVKAAQRTFPEMAAKPDAFPYLDAQSVPTAAALARLVESIPNELLVLPPDKFSNLLAGTAALGAIGVAFQSTRAPDALQLRVRGFEQNPIWLIRDALASCPDEAPAPGTTELAFIAYADLRESIRLDMSTAHSDLAEGEWKGATVLAGSATEALLLWALQEEEKQKAGTLGAVVAALVGSKVLTKNPGGDPEAWGLHEYVEVARHLDLIEDDTAKLIRLAKDFRNLIHPGRAARLGQKCDRATALGALAAVEAVARDLTP